MVQILGTLRRPPHPGSPIALPIRSYHRDQNFRRCMYHRPASKFYFLIPEQNQSNGYREALIAGDSSENDVNQAEAKGIFLTTDPDTSSSIAMAPSTPFTSPNRVCPSSSLAVSELKLSIHLRLWV